MSTNTTGTTGSTVHQLGCRDDGHFCSDSSDCCDGAESCTGGVCCPTVANQCALDSTCDPSQHCRCGECCLLLRAECTEAPNSCCAGQVCIATSNRNGGAVYTCRGWVGMTCSIDTDCSSDHCASNHVCACASPGELCHITDDCCAGNCTNGHCGN